MKEKKKEEEVTRGSVPCPYSFRGRCKGKRKGGDSRAVFIHPELISFVSSHGVGGKKKRGGGEKGEG